MRQIARKHTGFPCVIDALEPRCLLSASVTNGVLTVDGTAGADAIRVRYTSNGQIKVVENGVATVFARNQVQSVVINGSDGDDLLMVSDVFRKAATINGGNGNDTVIGGVAADVLHGDDGSDTLYPRAGDDTLDGGTGSDDIYGGDGSDTADYSSRTDISTGFFSLDGAANDGDFGVEFDNIRVDVENITGAPVNGQTIRGNNFANRLIIPAGFTVGNLSGFGGDDYLQGGDLALGGEGNDTIIDAAEADGEAGNDIITNASQASGGDGDDTITGTVNGNVLEGNNGNDIIHGGNSVDLITGGGGNDQLFGEGGDDTIDGGAGIDTLTGGDGNDNLVNSDGLDVVIQ